MEKFIAEFDPLVGLEAEYAAVVARTRVPPPIPADDEPEATDQSEKRDEEPAESDNDEDDGDDDASLDEEHYAPLAADSDGEYENPDTEEESDEPAVAPVSVAAAPPKLMPMDDTTKRTIMATMQSLQLQPPPWARDAIIPDKELLALVQQRLFNSAQQ